MDAIQTSKAILVLKTCDLPTPGSTNIYGSVNIDRTEYTFSNINWRLLLGDLYDKYDLFTLKLDNISMGMHDYAYDNTSGQYTYLFGSGYEDRMVYIEMEGLKFINNTYAFKEGQNNGSAVLAPFNFDYGQPIKTYENDATLTFSKSSAYSNITFRYKTIYNNDKPLTLAGNIFPNVSYRFSIYGIPKENTRDTRMITVS